MGRAQAGRMFVSGPLNKHLPTTVSSLSLSSHIPLIHHRHSCSHKHSHTKTPQSKKKKIESWPARSESRGASVGSSQPPEGPPRQTPHHSDDTGCLECMRTYAHTVFWQECAELSSRPGLRRKAGSPILPVTVGFPKVSLALARCLWAHVDVFNLQG